MKSKNNRAPFSFLTRACLMLVFSASAAQSATFTNTGTTGTVNWSTGTDWDAIPESNLDTILSYTSTLAASDVVVSNNDIATPPFKLNQLGFTNAGPGSGTAPTLSLTGSQLEFITNSSAATPTLIFNTTGTVKPVIDIQNNLLLTNNLGVAATTDGKLSGVISGTGSVAKTGAGTLTLTGNNSYGGGTTVGTGGTLVLTNSNAAGTGTIDFRGNNGNPTLRLDGTGGNILLTNSLVNNGGNLVNAAGNNKVTSNLSINSGTSNSYFTVDAGTLELAGNYGAGTTGRNAWLQGAGTGLYSGNLTFGNNNIRKDGTGTWILSGSNTYTGLTEVRAGTLIARSANALGTGAGGVTVNANANLSYVAAADAALNLGATLAITGGLSTTIGGSIGSTATSARINVTGAATTTVAAVKVNLSVVNGVTPAAGTYTLIQGGGGSTLNNATYTVGTIYNNTNFTVGSLSSSTSDLQANLTAQTPLTSAFWVGGLAAGTNVWAASDGSTQSNWTATSGGGAQPLVPGVNTDVTISNSAVTTAPTATVLGSNMTIKSLTIADTSNGLGLISDSSTLTITPLVSTTGITMNSSVPTSTIATSVRLGATQTWTNDSTNLLTVSGAIDNGVNGLTIGGSENTLISGALGSGAGGLTKTGAGTLTLSAANSFTGTTLISGGKIVMGNALALQNSAYDTTGSNGSTIGLDVTSGLNAGALTLGGLSGGVNLASAITDEYGSVSNLTLRPQTGSAVVYSGEIANGASGMTLNKIGAGTQTLSGSNSFTGNVGISAGTLAITNSSALGLGNKNINLTSGGTLALDNTGTGSDIVLGSNLAFNGNTIAGATIRNVAGDNSIASSLVISFNATNVYLRSDAGSLTLLGAIGMNGYGNARILNLQGAGNGTISGNISDTSASGNLSIIKVDGGTWTLSGANNSYRGATTVNGGTLAVSGTLTASAVTVNNTGSAISVTGAGALATSLTVNSGAHLAIAVANTAAAQPVRTVSGAVTLDSASVLDLTAAGTPAAGTYTLLGAGSLTTLPTTINKPTLAPGTTWTVTNPGDNSLVLTVTTASGFATWIGSFNPPLSDPNDRLPGADPDNDGISNLMEYVLYQGDPTVSSPAILPSAATPGSNVVFTFYRRNESTTDTTQTFQYGSNLSGWTDLAIPGGAGVVVTPNTPSSGIDKVEVTITRTGNPKLFGRLKVVQP